MIDNQLTLPNGKIITLNDQQTEGLGKILEWLKSDKMFFTLAGVAGSGKSTISKKIIELCNIYESDICISAPTHKAVKVVSRMSEIQGKTMHTILGLRPDVQLENFLPNFPEFAPIAPPKIGNYKLIFIDEASMINSELFKFLKKLNRGFKVKILFMGDPCQIPPVGEAQSVVFSDPEIEIFWLTKVIRQKGSNPLMPIYDAIRSNLDDYYGGFERITNINEKGEGVLFTSSKGEFRNLIIEEFSSDKAKNDIEYVKLIAWTNDSVMKSNYLIRNIIYGENPDIVELNENLMGYRTISDATMKFNIIENSGDYRVIKKSTLEENMYGILGYRLTLREKIDETYNNDTDVFLIDNSDHVNLHRYAGMHDMFRDQAVKNKKLWRKYYEFRRKNMILVDIDQFENGAKRGKKDYIKKDICYGYSITGHKSQGSTYNRVFLLLNNIYESSNINERNRITYVALSRPTTIAFVLYDLIPL